MKIAGYVRETPGKTDPDTAFAQSERIRRWTASTASELIAICQDHHTAAAPMDRPGFKAVLEIARSDGADAVVLGNLAALSPDKIAQEIMIHDLTRAGVQVIATDEDDIRILGGRANDHVRMVVRDSLDRIAEYRDAFGLSGDVPDGELAAAPHTMPEAPKQNGNGSPTLAHHAPNGGHLHPSSDPITEPEPRTTDVVVELLPRHASAVE